MAMRRRCPLSRCSLDALGTGATNVRHGCRHVAGVADDLLVEEPQGLPTGACRLGVPQMIATEIADARVPTPAIGLEDQPHVRICRIDEPGDRASTGQRELTHRSRKPRGSQHGEKPILELALRRYVARPPLVEDGGELSEATLARPGDLRRTHGDLGDRRQAVGHDIDDVTEPTAADDRRQVDDRSRRDAHRQAVALAHVMCEDVVDLVHERSRDPVMVAVAHRESERVAGHVPVVDAVDQEGRLVAHHSSTHGQVRRPQVLAPRGWRGRHRVDARVAPHPGSPRQAPPDLPVRTARRPAPVPGSRRQPDGLPRQLLLYPVSFPWHKCASGL
ncbi:MAG TPA: hypothetical protein VE623_11345 [Acidimicrobiales bacterium]|nr:hypothetical protein [Acidimicrobiales bacterium]